MFGDLERLSASGACTFSDISTIMDQKQWLNALNTCKLIMCEYNITQQNKKYSMSAFPTRTFKKNQTYAKKHN
jgi:hypothetical protein